MCVLCDETKRKFPSYKYCPYCGESYSKLTFIPNYIIKETYECDKYGKPQGLSTLKSVKFRQ